MLDPDLLPPLLTMDEAAELMRMPKRSLRRLVAIGILPSIKLRRLVRIPTSDMLAVLAENQQARERARIERAHAAHASSQGGRGATGTVTGKLS